MSDKLEPSSSDPLIGPFTAEQDGLSGHVIRNGDGAVICWTVGNRTAWCVAGLLNMADQHRLLN